MTSAVKVDATGYWLEVAISKTAVEPALPASGDVGVDFAFHDNDQNLPAQSTTYGWSDPQVSADYPSHLPDRWGTLRLIEPTATVEPPVENAPLPPLNPHSPPEAEPRTGCGCTGSGAALPLAALAIIAFIRRRRIALGLALLGAACGGLLIEPPPDVAVIPGVDAGAGDAGVAVDDAGTPEDAGAPRDAGTPVDAGAPRDAGAQVDAGVCEPLLRMGLQVFHVREGMTLTTRMGTLQNPALVNDTIFMNATPRVAEFPGDARGQEQLYACQDPLGPLWSSNVTPRPNVYLASFKPSQPGEYVVRACPRRPPGACGEVAVIVR